MFLSTTAARGLAFIFFVMAARWVTEADYGQIRTAVAWAAVCSLLIAPFSLVWTRTLASLPSTSTVDSVQEHVAAGLRAFVLLLLLTLVVATGWTALDERVGWAALAVLVGTAVLYAVEGYLKGRLFYWRLAAFLVVGNLLQLLAIVLAQALKPGLLNAESVQLVYGAAFVLPVPFLLRDIRARVAPSEGLVSGIVRESAALATVSGANALILHLDLLVLAYLVDLSEVGYYGAAKTLLAVSLVLAQAFYAVVLPITAGSTDSPDLDNHALSTIVVASLIPAAALYAMADPVVRIVFTERYEPAVSALRVLSWGAGFYSIFSAVMANLLGQHRDALVRRHYMLVVVVSAGLLFALVPRLGILGASWAFTCACATGCASALLARFVAR